MKLVSQLPNLFDQYSTPENRVTNALLQTLASSTTLVRGFLERFCPSIPLRGVSTFEIWTQRKPGDEDATESSRYDTVPDGWFVLRDKDDNVLRAIALEVKIFENTADLRQLNGHRSQAKRRSLEEHAVLLITPDIADPFGGMSSWESGTYQWTSWKVVHRYLRLLTDRFPAGSSPSHLLTSIEEYLDMADIVGFTGIRFPHGYNIPDAKRILKSLRQEIAPDVARVLPGYTRGKGNLKEPWDVFAPEDGESFTAANHLTLSVGEEHLAILLAVPNKNGAGWRRLRDVLGRPDQLQLLREHLATLRAALPNVTVIYKQRHYHARRYQYQDGYIEVDLDTTDFARTTEKTGVKANPVFFELLLQALAEADPGPNREFNVVTKYWYRNHKETIGTEDFKDEVVQALAAFRPLLEFLGS